jgi:hypothetical protein
LAAQLGQFSGQSLLPGGFGSQLGLLRRYLEPRLLQFSLKAFEPLQGPQGRLAGGGGPNPGCQARIALQEQGCGGVGAEPEGLAAGWECQGRLQGRQGQIGGHRCAA